MVHVLHKYKDRFKIRNLFVYLTIDIRHTKKYNIFFTLDKFTWSGINWEVSMVDVILKVTYSCLSTPVDHS
jgi:hypothetical protein